MDTQEFLQKYGTFAGFDPDLSYALPAPLVELIPIMVPDFFKPDELQFERDFAELNVTGFFRSFPFTFSVLTDLLPFPDVCPDPNTDPIGSRQGEVSATWDELLLELEDESSITAAKFNKARQVAEQQKDRQAVRRLAYAGWLMTHPPYLAERDALRLLADKLPDPNWEFPVFVRVFMGVPVVPPKLANSAEEQEFAFHFIAFRKRWGLETLLSWDLPVPLQVEVSGNQGYPELETLSSTGLQLFIPWYLMREKDLRLDELIQSQTMILDTPVRSWIESSGKKDLGIERSALLFLIHFTLNLTLKPRYGESLRRCTGKLLDALTQYLAQQQWGGTAHLSLETMIQVRKELNRILKSIST